MNPVSSLHARHIARRFLFCMAVPLGVFASAAHAHTLDQTPAPSPDTIAKQFPAIPATTAPVATAPNKLAQTDTTVPGAAASATAPADVPVPVADPTATANPALAETGLISQDVLFAGLALLALGAGFVLGVENK
jgi:uncharacterized membrane protein